MSQCTCLRCGHTWFPRSKVKTVRSVTSHRLEKRFVQAESKRCAKCRTPFWNKPYVRKMSPARLNANSSYDAQDIPLLKRAGISGLQLDQVRIKISPSELRATVGNRKKAPTAHRRRAGEHAAKMKHGTSKGKKCQG